MRRVLLAALAALVLPALLSGRAQAIPYSFTTIDEPNATPRGGGPSPTASTPQVRSWGVTAMPPALMAFYIAGAASPRSMSRTRGPLRDRSSRHQRRGPDRGELRRRVNAGEKMHRRAGVKMHYGRMGGRPRMRGTGSSSVTAKSALQFDQ